MPTLLWFQISLGSVFRLVREIKRKTSVCGVPKFCDTPIQLPSNWGLDCWFGGLGVCPLQEPNVRNRKSKPQIQSTNSGPHFYGESPPMRQTQFRSSRLGDGMRILPASLEGHKTRVSHRSLWRPQMNNNDQMGVSQNRHGTGFEKHPNG